NYSPRRVMEFLGETDPQGALREYIQWQFYLAKMRGKVQRIEAEESGKLEQMAAQMAQEMMAQMGPPPAPTGEPVAAGGAGNGVLPPELLALLNPNAGGPTPIEGMGDLATFEGGTGETRGGETTAGAFPTLGQ
ncbi:MAG: hypothetical protein ACRDHG_02600, partial [Anaerolineales bacterium]